MVGYRSYWKACLSVFLLLAAAPAAPGALLVGQITLRADSTRLPADPSSSVVITIEVLDATGKPVPDGTSVNLITTLGEIVSPVQTIGGLAQTVLTPSPAAGTALVSAMVGSARATLEIEFIAGPGSASPGSRMVEVSGEELSYSPDRRMFVVGPSARLVYETVEIRADGMEYDVMSNVVCAQGAVVVKSGASEIRADALRYDLSSLRGRLLRVPDPSAVAPSATEGKPGEPIRLLVEGEKLQTRPDTTPDPGLWYPLRQDEIRTWIKARSAIVHPRGKVILDHAAVYVDDLRVMGMRRHVMDPRRGTSLFGPTFGYSSLFGPALNIPYYYRASGSQIGALHFTHNQTVGGVGGEPRWALGLKEEWIREGRSEGSLSLQDITHPTRGMEWQHQLQLGAGSALSMDAGVSTFQNGMPQLRAAGLMYYRPLSAGRLSLSLSGSDFGTSQYYFGAVAYRFKGCTLGSGILITPLVSLRQSFRHSETNQILIDPSTGDTLEINQESSGRTTSPGIDLDVSLPTRALNDTTQLNASLHTGYAWGLSGGSRPLLNGRVGVVKRFAPTDYVRLDYSYSGAPASLQPTPFSIGRQRLSLNGRVKLRGFDVLFNASQEIGGDRLFGNLILFRPLPWGKDRDGESVWALSASHMFTHLTASNGTTGGMSEYKLASSRLALSRRMGQYRLAICYSPQGKGGFESQPWVSLDGYGYTYSGGRHLWIEVMSAGF